MGKIRVFILNTKNDSSSLICLSCVTVHDLLLGGQYFKMLSNKIFSPRVETRIILRGGSTALAQD